MCGLVVLASTAGAGVDLDELHSATTALSHRGPDDVAFTLFWLDGRAPLVVAGEQARSAEALYRAAGSAPFLGIGFRRLSIIDPTPAGRQPMGSPDGSRWLAFNGELYNYLELRERFGRSRTPVTSESDTEVLARILSSGGWPALTDTVGMFALAFVDLRDRRLLLSRDPFGIKPLFYAVRSGRIAVASELPALLRCGWIGRRLDLASARDFLALAATNHCDATLLSDVRQIRPGEAVTILLAGSLPVLQSVRYMPLGWPKPAALPFSQAVVRVREAFLRSVELHMRSDVPVAFTLSGGLDSSSIAAAARHLFGDTLEINSFGYVPRRESLQHEGRWMKMAAESVKARHTLVQVDVQTLRDDLEMVAAAQGEPLTSPDPVAQLVLYRKIHEHGFKVALDGQGADELFGGYASALPARVASLILQGRPDAAYRLARTVAARDPNAPARLTLRTALSLLAGWIGPNHGPQAGSVPFGRPRWFEQRVGLAQRPLSIKRGRFLHGMLRSQITSIDLPMLLRTADRNAMASSVENRVPFLTPALGDLAQSLDEGYLVASDGTRKHVLREAMRGLVPDELLDRRDKQGFASTEPEWLPAVMAWTEDTMRNPDTGSLPFLDGAAWRVAWDEAARQAAHGVTPANLEDLWRWASLSRWIGDMHVEIEA